MLLNSIMCVAGIIFVIGLVYMSYVKAAPDEAILISGITKEPRIIRGRASFRVPFFERIDFMDLSVVKIDVKTSKSVPTAEYININVDSVVTMQVSLENISVAARNFLNQENDYLTSIVTDILEGNLREIIGTMRLTEMIADRNGFANKVLEGAAPDMEQLGLEIKTFNIQNFYDDAGVINDLGIDNTVKIQKAAKIARAEAERDIAMAAAKADKEAKEAQITAAKEIAVQQNNLAIRQSELKIEADIKKAEADAAYAINQEAQRKFIEIKKSEANIAQQEKEVELKSKEAEVKEQSLIAEIKKQADAELYREQKNAEAELYKRQKDAEASLIEAQKEAEAVEARGRAEATAITAKGLAEANAVKAKGLAEAEAMDKKAEAYQKYNKAAIAEMLINVLPDVASKVAEPLGKIDKITVYGGGDGGNTIDSVSGNVPAMIKKTFDTMKDVTGVDFTDIVKASTYDAQVKREIEIKDSGDLGSMKEAIAIQSTADKK